MSHRFRMACLLVVAALVPAAQAKVTLPNVFSDHMVLQRESAVPVWGSADPGEGITVTLGDTAVTTQADAAGKWRVDLNTGPAGGPFVLTVTGNEAADAVVIRDVLLGEVWLCAGQSNMEWPVNRADHAEVEITDGDQPTIRQLLVPHIVSAKPLDDQPAKWQLCTPQTVAGFSAVGYFFARNLQKELDVPIGLLNINWGGTRIEPWTPIEGFALIESLAPIHQRVLLQDPASAAHAAAAKSYIAAVTSWTEQAKAAVAKQTAFDAPPAMPAELVPFADRQDPTTLYNAMLRPVIPFRIRGAIWYQGESNHTESDYVDKTLALVKGWRKVWQPDIPYYYVQIAPYKYGDERPEILPAFWEQQANIEQALDDSAMAVISDIGNLDNIHPTNKQGVGKRLANLALSRTYGKTGIVDTGPRFKSLAVESDSLRVTFDHAAGLTTRDGKAPDCFEVIGTDTGWHDADATIEGDAVVLRSPKVAHPVAVRFAWHKLATPNLMNAEGLPTAPFRAGVVPDTEPLTRDVTEDDDYQLVYDIDLHKLARAVTYDVDNTATITQPFDRVAYYLELQKPGQPLQWVYVSMNAFTDDITKVGIPTFESEARFQQPVSGLFVASNVNIPTGQNLEGNIEFWPNNYSGANSAGVDGAANTYDFGDNLDANKPDGYGSMQVHFTRAKTTLFAINHWFTGENADLGIGNATTGPNPDWTFTKNGPDYEVKRLRVLVHPKQ